MMGTAFLVLAAFLDAGCKNPSTTSSWPNINHSCLPSVSSSWSLVTPLFAFSKGFQWASPFPREEAGMERGRRPTGGSSLPPKAREGRKEGRAARSCSQGWARPGCGSLPRTARSPLGDGVPAPVGQLCALEVCAEGSGIAQGYGQLRVCSSPSA